MNVTWAAGHRSRGNDVRLNKSTRRRRFWQDSSGNAFQSNLQGQLAGTETPGGSFVIASPQAKSICAWRRPVAAERSIPSILVRKRTARSNAIGPSMIAPLRSARERLANENRMPFNFARSNLARPSSALSKLAPFSRARLKSARCSSALAKEAPSAETPTKLVR